MKSKQAMKQVLGIRDEKTRMKVTPPLAVAPITQEDDMRWNPNDDGIVFNPIELQLSETTEFYYVKDPVKESVLYCTGIKRQCQCDGR